MIWEVFKPKRTSGFFLCIHNQSHDVAVHSEGRLLLSVPDECPLKTHTPTSEISVSAIVLTWRGGPGTRSLLLSLLLLAAWEFGSGQVHYCPEEAKHGTFVGRSQDLGLELAELVPRLFRAASKEHQDLLEVNLQNGILFVNSRIDCKELCGRNLECSIHLEVIVERPLVFHVEMEVKDINDNTPVSSGEQKVLISESAPLWSLFPLEGASDADIGVNSSLTYRLGLNQWFLTFFESLDREETPEINILLTALDGVKPELTGSVHIQITVMDVNNIALEFDKPENNEYEIHVNTIDKGIPSMAGHCTVLVAVLDLNDNIPKVTVTSLSLPVPEISGHRHRFDQRMTQDSGTNGQVTCSLTPHVPFKLVPIFRNYYSVMLDSALDRKSVSEYAVAVADVNDNTPMLARPEYTVFAEEKNPPGCHIFTVSAQDLDAQENALVSYSLLKRQVGERALSSYVSVHADSGKVYALQPLDHEELELLQFQVSARDAGVRPLGSNVTLQVFVLDENDNAPALLPPGAGMGGASSELVSRSVCAGQVAAKVRAVDADSGYNAWLSYKLQPAARAIRRSFCVGLYTGEISTTRSGRSGRAVPVPPGVGERSWRVSACGYCHGAVVAGGQWPGSQNFVADVGEGQGSRGGAGGCERESIIGIGAVSGLLVFPLLLYMALRCSVTPTEGARAREKPTAVCSSSVGSWSYSQERRQRVCSGEGPPQSPPKTDLLAFSPSSPQSVEDCVNSFSESCAQNRQNNYCSSSIAFIALFRLDFGA
ncbi:LOW QUALITY PROTEIN: protocadherin alpha-12-like [Rhynchonycteris naso]